MLNKLTPFIIAFFGFCAGYSLGQCEDHVFTCGHKRAFEHRNDFNKAYLSSRGLADTYDVVYHRMEWEVDPSVLYIQGTVTTYFIVKEAGLSELNFDFSDTLSVNNVNYHGMSIPYNRPGNHVISVPLTAALDQGKLDSISITYEGRPTATGLGSFKVGVHGITAEPVLWTLSEPYGARDWWPCKQDLNDKIDSIDIYVTTPSPFKTASNGVLMSEIDDGVQKTMHWKHRYKIPAYLISITIADYDVLEYSIDLPTGDSVKIVNMVYPEKKTDWIYTVDPTTKYMQYFSEKFGIYPFYKEKYGHASFSWSGGMEHQTMSSMGGSSKRLIAHEMAHQWFGNKITCGSWRDLWLNEGFATYLTELTIELFSEPNTWQDYKESYNKSITSLSNGSVYIKDTTDIARIFDFRLTYQKASVLLRMLRWELGDAAFFDAIFNYINDPELSYGYARTTDLIAHLENSSGQDLTGFFNDWFYGEGYPTYQIDAYQNGADLKLTVKQNTSNVSVDFYEGHIPIYCAGEGKDTLYRLSLEENGQSYQLKTPFKIDSISFDPTYFLISGKNDISFRSETEKIELFPNPVIDLLQINSAERVNKLEIFSTEGKKIYSSNLSFIGTELDVSKMSAGLYLLKFTLEDREEVLKVIKN